MNQLKLQLQNTSFRHKVICHKLLICMLHTGNNNHDR